ncbi:heavy metal-binding domain-containing protein [Flavitalea flava]
MQLPTIYTCPMHPDVTSRKQGKCPKCGMKFPPAKEMKDSSMRM